MMDRDYIDAIIKVILESDMTDRNVKRVSLRPMTCEIRDGKEVYDCELNFSDVIGHSRAKLSEAWVASNLLIFTVFDGYLEVKYGLQEGGSFRNHYQHLPMNDDIELIQKDCYRIMKLIRNAAQHNLSSIAYNNGSYSIRYVFNGTEYILRINKNGMDCLYTLLINIIRESIIGLYGKFHTKGHFVGILRRLYEEMCSEVDIMTDEEGVRTNMTLSCIKLQYSVRYPVANPVIIDESSKIIFKHIANMAFVDPNGVKQYYSTDYAYKDYLLPQEIGVIEKNGERGYDTIEFDKSRLCDLWKIG